MKEEKVVCMFCGGKLEVALKKKDNILRETFYRCKCSPNQLFTITYPQPKKKIKLGVGRI